MKLRDKPIYLSYEVWRALWLLAKAELRPQNERDAYDSGIAIASPDKIADNILRQAIREQHPRLLEHQAEIDRLEKELIKSLQDERARS